jgi:DNA-binding transcriptional LysR family regulator
MLDTDQLRSFLAIVDTGSFTRAADRVNKTQSAVSMHIRRLEEQLERDLFIKQGRGARLSVDGERLVEHARRMLQVEAAALHDIKGQGLGGRVILGIPDDYAEPFLPDIVGQFARLNPLVDLSIVCYPSVRLAECAAAGEIDLAVVTGDRIKGVEILREEPLCWVTGARVGAVEDKRPLPLALSTPSCRWRNAALAALERVAIESRIFLMSANYAALGPIVQAGLALTVLPREVATATGHRIVPAAAGLPPLPNVQVGLIFGAPSYPREADALADVIRSTIGGRASPARDAA